VKDLLNDVAEPAPGPGQGEIKDAARGEPDGASAAAKKVRACAGVGVGEVLPVLMGNCCVCGGGGACEEEV
jgi:hypothetical protein